MNRYAVQKAGQAELVDYVHKTHVSSSSAFYNSYSSFSDFQLSKRNGFNSSCTSMDGVTDESEPKKVLPKNLVQYDTVSHYSSRL